MNKAQGTQFLEALGVQVTSAGSGWLRAKCPLSPFTHQKGHDSSPSFGLTINEGATSSYHCFACSSGSMEKLLQELEFHSDYGKKAPGKFNFKLAREILEAEDLKVIPLPEYTEFTGLEQKPLIPWDEGTFDLFPSAVSEPVSRRYLAYRGFTLKEASEYGLRVDLHRNMLVFPYRDVFGKPAGMRGRLMDFGQPMTYVDKHGETHPQLKHYDYTIQDQNGDKVNNAYHCWYGEEDLQKDGPVVIVEGQFDRMRVKRVFPRVLANMTAKPSQKKLEKLSYAPGVVILTDNDETGISASLQWVDRLSKYGVSIAMVSLVGAKRSKMHGDRYGHGAPKDPDEAAEDWLRESLAEFM